MTETDPSNPSAQTHSGSIPREESSGCDTREAFARAFRKMEPPPEAGRHFRQARIEFLKGIRELLDHRIQQLSRDPQPKGTRITVE